MNNGNPMIRQRPPALGRRRVVAPIPAITCSLLACGWLALPSTSEARTTTLTGEAALTQAYDSNVYHTQADHLAEWTTGLAPRFTLTTKGSDDTVALSYAPNFVHNHRRDEVQAEQRLSVSADKALAARWKLTFSDQFSHADKSAPEVVAGSSRAMNFQRLDPGARAEIVRLLFPELTWTGDPTQMLYVQTLIQTRYTAASSAVQAEVDSLLTSPTAGGTRTRHWTNVARVGTSYEIAKDSLLNVAYVIRQRDTRTDTQADSLSHGPQVNLGYRFNPQWKSRLGLGYEDTNFDTSNDLGRTTASVGFDYQPNQKNQLSTDLDFASNAYDGSGIDQNSEGVRFGWKHDLSERTSVGANLGGNYLLITVDLQPFFDPGHSLSGVP